MGGGVEVKGNGRGRARGAHTQGASQEEMKGRQGTEGPLHGRSDGKHGEERQRVLGFLETGLRGDWQEGPVGEGGGGKGMLRRWRERG